MQPTNNSPSIKRLWHTFDFSSVTENHWKENLKKVMIMWSLLSYCIVAVAVTLAAARADTLTKIHNGTKLVNLDTVWITIADLDATVDDCPKGWTKAKANNIDVCRSPSDDAGCYSTTFKVNGEQYHKVFGMVVGYQKGTTDGFAPSTKRYGINEPYVDGVSITLITDEGRKHVWSYGCGIASNIDRSISNCPCSVYPGQAPPSFVGEHYYCQSGNQGSGHSTDVYYTTYPLWNGTGCDNIKDDCCANVGLPYFYREFPTVQDSDFEVRICSDGTFANEAVLVSQLALYVAYN